MKTLCRIIFITISLFSLTGCLNKKSNPETNHSDTEIQSNFSKSDTLSLTEIKKLLRNKSYLNSQFNVLYSDFEKNIKEITWIDEPPSKLVGVYLWISKECFLRVELINISDSARFNIERDWVQEIVRNSIIRELQLFKKNEIIFEQKNK